MMDAKGKKMTIYLTKHSPAESEVGMSFLGAIGFSIPGSIAEFVIGRPGRLTTCIVFCNSQQMIDECWIYVRMCR